jgi:glucose-6-phosphate 1-dehydrogenase
MTSSSSSSSSKNSSNNFAPQLSFHRNEDSIPSDDGDTTWLTDASLTIVVVGASGDLAKKKTYPSLLNLFVDKLLPRQTRIWGFARSQLTDQDLRDRLLPYLEESKHSEEHIHAFLQQCFYQGGQSYGDVEAFSKLAASLQSFEDEHKDKVKMHNRLFYFAIPPNVFGETAVAIKKTSMQDEAKGWSRLIVEKPFGRDLESFEELNSTLSKHFTEDHLYRIDHYLVRYIFVYFTLLSFFGRIIHVPGH